MKINIILTFSALATTALAGPFGNDAPKLDGLPKDKTLPLHQLPDCWQDCFQSNNKWFFHDIYTISQYDFCEDKGAHSRNWYVYRVDYCVPRVCKDRAERQKGRNWYNAILQYTTRLIIPILAMKLIALLGVAVLAATARAGEGKNAPKLDGLPKDKRLPLHQLPECYQDCIESNNKWYFHDIYTISQYHFCEDKWAHFRSWDDWRIQHCLPRACPDGTVHEKAANWFDAICRQY
ncbi:hypothetical protein CkaCkLH20_11342 [Colletotrichum karsti]|uniref:Uncharacterized protein n=1 Tax=Colletotrichum karsti TaxID=1095194 RepID=A0A9P6HUT5_9PEZI|nr:uncharacterized protein CkaCkLH20_11342 [Colletotrichum karsti]KAF9871173.1 hypothetical protein CkaCkLH20_11342 [Colletotrichum karsti]